MSDPQSIAQFAAPSDPDSRHDPSAEPVVDARDLMKSYTFHEQAPGVRGALAGLLRRRTRTRVAVDDLSFAVSPGEIVGLLGPNGAGKTTTLKMLCGLLRPTAGDVRVLGHRPADRDYAFLRRIAVVLGQKSMLWWDVPAMDSFLVHKAMYGMSGSEFADSVAELTELLDLGDLLNVPVRKLSLGQRMRCELMLALLHRPDVLFLDEPTIGLDVVAKARVREFLARVNAARATTIVLTSHDMDDVEALCRRVLLVDGGRLRYDGDLTGLARSVRPGKRVRATYRDNEVVISEVAREDLPGLWERLCERGELVDVDVSDADLDDVMRDVFDPPGAR